MTRLNPETRDKLKRVSTATLATALFKRGFRNQMIQGVQPPTDEANLDAFKLWRQQHRR